MPTRGPRAGARWAVRRAEPDAKMSLVNVNVKKIYVGMKTAQSQTILSYICDSSVTVNLAWK